MADVRRIMDEQQIDERASHIEQPLAYSVDETARLLGIGRTLAWDLVRGGELRSVRLRGRVLIPRDVIEARLRG